MSWSRSINVTDADGIVRRWHLLDSANSKAAATADAESVDDASEQPTLLCLHGNPTWSYLWRRMLAAPPVGWRVVAPDQLGMGYSERLSVGRTLAERVRDLGDLTAALGITGPVVLLAHDWGGIISLGWAQTHRDQLRGVVLTNTAVHQPEHSTPPALIRLAHLRALRELSCVRTPIFVRAATALSRPPLDRAVRDAFAAPYRTAVQRRSVGDFVADIPFGQADPSRPALDEISEDVRALNVPALLLWGPRDPVFGEQYLQDLRERLPQAQLHRYEKASHLLPEDAPQYAADVATWIGDLDGTHSDGTQPDGTQPALALPELAKPAELAEPREAVWQRLSARADNDPDEVAVSEFHGARNAAASLTSLTWAELERQVLDMAADLTARGVRRGQRVALLVPPSIELTVAVYAVWQVGAAIVVADKGLGLRGMGRALRSANVDHVIGSRPGLAVASLTRVPGSRLKAKALGKRDSSRDSQNPRADGVGSPGWAVAPSPETEMAVVFTSGATGPAKGVVYQHDHLLAQLRIISQTYQLTPADRIVAAFAPFALYGPALGLASIVPDVDVTAPGTLTASALADAVAAIEASVMFASPAALRNVLATSSQLSEEQRGELSRIRLLMSAGAAVPLPLLHDLQKVLPEAEAHTPYGMTEVLPVTDISAVQIEAAGDGDGVCVGRPLAGVEVAISPVDPLGRAEGELTRGSGVSGEICVRAPHGKARYDALWATERASSRNPGWHRTGDIGYLDATGLLWVQGRLQHLITTPDGVLTPIGLEQELERLPEVRAAAVVGVGPAGTQQVVAVLVPTSAPRRRKVVAELRLIDAVQSAASAPIAAVLQRRSLPVDIRHASKVDRQALARWAEGVLAGR